MKKQLQCGFAFGLIGVASLAAQDSQPKDVIFHQEIVGPAAGGPNMIYHQAGTGPMGPTVDFVGTEMIFDGKPVKAAPYSAEAVTETVQILSDGNRITHKSTSSIYRDSEGRTRREETMGAIGPWAAGASSQQMIFINDPVAGANYELNPQTHIAHKLTLGALKAKAEKRELEATAARGSSGVAMVATIGPGLHVAGVEG